MVLNFARSVFTITYPVALLLSVFVYGSNLGNYPTPTKEKSRSKLESTIRLAGTLIACAIFLIGIILINFKYKNFLWLSIAICLPTYLSNIAGTYVSIGIIGKVIQSENSNKLSVREHWALETFSYAVFWLDFLKLPTKLLDILRNLESTFASDCLYISLYIILLFLYLFLTCSLIPIPLICLSKLLVKLNAFLKKTKFYCIGNYFVERIEKHHKGPSVFLKAVQITKAKHIILRIIVWGASPVFLLLDAGIIIVKTFWSLLLTSIGYIFLILKMIKKTIGKVICWLNRLSDRRLVATSFRVALIATMTATVITNRYMPLFRSYESSTATLEFIASAIIIPVVFEWISSNTKKSTA